MSFPFLTRSRTWPTEASTAYCRPRNFLRVLVFAGLSTISRFLAISETLNAGGRRLISVGLYGVQGRGRTLPPGPVRPQSSGLSTLGQQRGIPGRPASGALIYKEGEVSRLA